MKRASWLWMAALVAAFLLSAALARAWDPGAYGYPPEIVAKLRAACYDPEVVGRQPSWPATRVFAYVWQEPQASWQKFVWGLKSDAYSFETAKAIRAKYASSTLGEWMQQNNKTLGLNPFQNATTAASYWKATVDRIAFRAGLLTQYSAGWNMSDPTIAAAVQKRVDSAFAIAFGAGSGRITDANGIMVPYAYGYAVNQPNLPGWWVKPASCTETAPTATPAPAVGTPIPTPSMGIPTPTRTPTAAPAAGVNCRNPETGECLSPPAIFGGACPAGWTVCGEAPVASPSPTRPSLPTAVPTAIPTMPPAGCAPPCICVCPTPMPSVPPTSTPTPAAPPPTPGGLLMCRDPQTGLCTSISPIFGTACPSGWQPCSGGTLPPTPTITPTPTIAPTLIPRPVLIDVPNVFATFWYGGSVIQENGSYTMWVTVNDGIWRLTSPDGLTWGDMQVVLWATVPWEDDGNGIDAQFGFQRGVSNACVLRLPGGYVMGYTAGPYLNTATRGGVGLAYSPDGIAWTKEPLNPVYRTINGETYAGSALVISGTPYFYVLSSGNDTMVEANYRIALDNAGRIARFPERLGYLGPLYPVGWTATGCWSVVQQDFGSAGPELSAVYRDGNCATTLGVKVAEITGGAGGRAAMLPFLLNRGPDGALLGEVPTFLYSAGDAWATWQLKAVTLKAPTP